MKSYALKIDSNTKKIFTLVKGRKAIEGTKSNIVFKLTIQGILPVPPQTLSDQTSHTKPGLKLLEMIFKMLGTDHCERDI